MKIIQRHGYNISENNSVISWSLDLEWKKPIEITKRFSALWNNQSVIDNVYHFATPMLCLNDDWNWMNQ